jgi:hypothetical protein
MLSKWSFSFKSPHQNLGCTSPLPHKCHTSRPNHPFHLITRMISGDLSVMQSYPISCYLVQSQNFFLSALFMNTHSLCSSLNVRNNISHINLQILNFFTKRCMYVTRSVHPMFFLLCHLTVQQCMFYSPSLCDVLHSHSSSLALNVLKSSPLLSTTQVLSLMTASKFRNHT